jgi:hypothetical protein
MHFASEAFDLYKTKAEKAIYLTSFASEFRALRTSGFKQHIPLQNELPQSYIRPLD